MAAPATRDLYDFGREELRLQVVRWGFSPVHAKRLWAYLHLELETEASAMQDLPVALRAKLKAETSVGRLGIDREQHS